MYGDIHRILGDGPQVRRDPSALGWPVEAIHRDRGADHAAPGEGQPAAQQLPADVLPVAVGAGRGAVQRLEHLVVGTDRQDVELFPDIEPLRRRHRCERAVRTRKGAAQVVEQDHRDLAGQGLDRFLRVVDTERLGRRAHLLCTQNR
jgi:hypothetical protein